MDSILTSVKKMLGIEEEDTHFDQDVIMNINAAIMSLTQLGVGPEEGYSITSKTETWSDLMGDRTDLGGIQTFVYLKVRLIFDPPTSSFVLESIESK